jgi:hypothetical protein
MVRTRFSGDHDSRPAVTKRRREGHVAAALRYGLYREL